MIKELTVYRKNFKEFFLQSCEPLNAFNLNMMFRFNGYLELGPDDVLWLQDDAKVNNRDSMLVVDHVDPDGPVRVRLADGGFVKDLKTFSEGDVFILAASFKVKDGNPQFHKKIN